MLMHHIFSDPCTKSEEIMPGHPKGNLVHFPLCRELGFSGIENVAHNINDVTVPELVVCSFNRMV